MSLILSGTDGLSDVDGSAATPAIRGTDANTGIFFPAADTIAFAEGGAEIARFDSSGNLLVGSTSNSFNSKFYVTGTPTANAPIASFYSQGNSSTAGIGLYNDSASVGIWTSSGNLIFRTNGNLASGAETMRIDSSGRVLIGTATPNTDVKTLIKASSATELQIQLEQSNVTDGYGLRCSASDGDLTFNRYQSSAYTERMRLSVGGNLTITGATATKASGTTWANPSDQRLKNNIRDYDKGTAELMQVRVREWEYNGKGGTTDGMKGLGVIADEVMTVLPATVENYDAKLNADDEETTAIKQFDATEITWLLVKTVQEQQALIQSLTDRITALETPAVTPPTGTQV